MKAVVEIIGEYQSFQRMVTGTVAGSSTLKREFTELSLSASKSAEAQVKSSALKIARMREEIAAVQSVSAAYKRGSDEQIDMFLNDFGNSRGPGLPTRRLGFRRPAVALEMFEQADGFLLRAYGQALLALSPELTPTYRGCDGSVPAEAGADADHECLLLLLQLPPVP